MNTKRVMVVVGTRPNFIKVTQFRRVAEAMDCELKLVHTGQHYDDKMAEVFFRQFGLTPDYFLEVLPGTPNSQMAEIMIRLEKVILEFKPDIVMVVGDVNSTMAAAITANKMNIKLAHVESGLRSFDRGMPEEFNRIVTDSLADICFVTEQSGMDHLRAEKSQAAIYFVGNTMIDTMVSYAGQIEKSPVLQTLGVDGTDYVLMTMHRPSNVDTREGLILVAELVRKLSDKYTIIFPVHPRTVKFMAQYGLEDEFRGNKKLIMTDPLDYFAFQKLIRHAKFILTDSGGIQEESTFMQIPCLTLRPNTERPVTVTVGSNVLLPFEINGIMEHVNQIENRKFKKGGIPELWDGHATERIFSAILKHLA